MMDVAVKNSPEQSQVGSALAKCAQVLLRRVFRILRGCGFSEDELKIMAQMAINEVEQIPDAQKSRVSARQAMMCCDVVLKWRRDYSFLDCNGIPKVISIDGGGEAASFAALVHLSAPGENPETLLRTMAELGVVRVIDDKLVELISESVVTCSGQDGQSIAGECVLEHICGFLGSVEFNVFDKSSRSKGRFERACYATVPVELVPIVQQLVRSRGQEFVDVIDEWLARRHVKGSDSVETRLVGAGAYIFVRENFD